MRKEKMTIDFDVFRLVRTEYRQIFTDAKAKLDAELETAKREYIGGRLRAETDEAKQRFTDTVTNARNKYKTEVIDLLDSEEDRVLKRLRNSPFHDIDILAKLSDFSISPIEFGELVKAYGGRSYWGDRMLSAIADKNDIEITNYDLEAPADIQLQVLDEIRTEVDGYLSRWDGTTYEPFTLLSDRKIYSWETRYGAHPVLDASQRADRSLQKLMEQGSQLERGQLLVKTLRNYADDQLSRDFLLYKISQTPLFGDVATRFAGWDAMHQVADYQSGKLEPPVLPNEKTDSEE